MAGERGIMNSEFGIMNWAAGSAVRWLMLVIAGSCDVLGEFKVPGNGRWAMGRVLPQRVGSYGAAGVFIIHGAWKRRGRTTGVAIFRG